MTRRLLSLSLFVVCATSASAQADTWSDAESETWRLDGSLAFARFEQQVKSEIGGMSADPILEEGSVGLSLGASYNVWRFIRLGLYAQLDSGSRYYGQFTGLEADGTPIVARAGGRFFEFWVGPLLRLQWRGLFAELAYGAFGIRSDDARTDLPSEDGDTDTAFRTSARVAWSFGIGGYVPVHPNIDVVFRIQYRIRYYTRRGGDSLEGGVAHGTQNLSPFVGVSWHR